MVRKPDIYTEYKCPLGKSSPHYNLPKGVVIGRYCKNNCGEYKNKKCPRWNN